MEKQEFTPAMIEEVEVILLGKKVKELTEVIDKQLQIVISGNGEDSYSIGLYNGLVLSRSILTGQDPVYYPDILSKGEKANG